MATARPGGRRGRGVSRMWDLYHGELKTLVTNRANFWLIASVTAILTVVALPFFYVDMEAYFVFAYAILPSFTTVVAATTYTKDRASGFASVVQTLPVSHWDYFASKFLASLTLGALFLLVTAPFTLLAMYYMGTALLMESFGRYLIFSVPLMMASIALGLFLSVCIGRRGLVASALTGFVLTALFAALSIFLREIAEGFSRNPSAEAEAETNPLAAMVRWISRISHLSPVVNAMDFSRWYATDPALAWKAVFMVVWFAAVLSVGAWFLYSRLQNPEGWDAAPWLAAASIGAVLVVSSSPVFALDFGDAPGSDMSFAMNPEVQLQLVLAPPTWNESRAPTCFHCFAGEDVAIQEPLRPGETRQFRAALVFFYVSPSGGVLTLEDLPVRVRSIGSAATSTDPERYVVDRVSLSGDNPRAVFTFDLNVTVDGTSRLGDAYAYLVPVVEGNLSVLTGGQHLQVTSSEYLWYSPMFVGGGLIVAEAAPFLWRGRRIGKRGA